MFANAADAPNTGQVPVDASPAERMEALIETLSSYIEYFHGGFVELISYEDDVLTVHLGGACEHCELSFVTLHGWVEGTVRQFFPDLKAVRAG